MNENDRIKYYETTDFSGLIKMKGKKSGGTAKRITLNISDKIYDEANELDSYMRMGYQNVLKTAMTIGLTELYAQVSNHKIGNTSTTRSTPSKISKKKSARKQQALQHTT
jgi:hypothetical protein